MKQKLYPFYTVKNKTVFVDFVDFVDFLFLQ